MRTLTRNRGVRAIAAVATLLLLLMLVGPGLRPKPVILDLEEPDLQALGESDRSQIEVLQLALRQHAPQDRVGLGQAYGELARHYLAVEFFDAADGALGNAAALDPKDLRWPYLMGYIDQNLGNFDEAVDHFEAARRLGLDDVPTLIRLAESQRSVGRDEAAASILERVLELENDHPTANYLLGLIALEREDFSTAVTRLEAVLKAQPGAGSVRNPLSQAYRGSGDLSSGTLVLQSSRVGRVVLNDPVLRQVLDLRRSATSRMSQARRLLGDRRIDEALALYREATTLEPDNIRTHVNLGSVLTELGRYEEARPSIEAALLLEPESSDANYLLGKLLLESGRPEDALEPLRIARERDADSREIRLALSEALFKARDCRSAVPMLRERLLDAETDVTSRLRLGVCLAAIDQYAKAIQVIEDGVALDSESPVLRAALSRLLSASPDADLRDGARALQLAEGLVKEGPAVDAFEVQAMAFAERGRYDEAVASAGEALALLPPPDESTRSAWIATAQAAYAQGRALREPWPPDLMGR